MTGRFQLLVKRYAQGAVSQYLHALEPGAMVSFKHIAFNVKRQYPFAPARTISLVAAGTGIAPVYQAALPLPLPLDPTPARLPGAPCPYPYP